MTNAERFKPYFTPTESLLLTLEWHEGMTVLEISETLGISFEETRRIQTTAREKARELKELRDERKAKRGIEDSAGRQLTVPAELIARHLSKETLDRSLSIVNASPTGASAREVAERLSISVDQSRRALKTLCLANKIAFVHELRPDVNNRKRVMRVYLPKEPK